MKVTVSENNRDYIRSINDEYKAIKHLYRGVPLKGQFILSNQKRTGVKSEDQSKFLVLKDIAEFNETALQWCASQNPYNVTEDDLNKLTCILTASQNRLREEMATTFVDGVMRGAGKHYKTLRAHTDIIDTEDAKVACDFVSAEAQRHLHESRGRGYRGSYNNFRQQNHNMNYGQQRNNYYNPPRFNRINRFQPGTTSDHNTQL